jgi:hypothetical protein
LAIRNPPRDVMLSHAGKRAGGDGWGFGLHEAVDQFASMSCPLAVAAFLTNEASIVERLPCCLFPRQQSLVPPSWRARIRRRSVKR